MLGGVETMRVNNGSVLLVEEQETSTEKKTILLWLWLMICRPHCDSAATRLQQIKPKLSGCWDVIGGCVSHYRQLAHYFSLLCFLLIIVTLLLTFCLLQLTLVFQTQSTLQDSKLRDLTDRLEKLNQSYRLLFDQYPALNQYCPVSNTSTGERACRPCPDGWIPQGQKCFLFSQDRASWISSQYRCMTLGGAVVIVRTEEEQVFLWKKAQSLSQGDSYWLGLRSSGGGAGWRWSDGSELEKGPQFWAHAPDEADDRELCGRLTPGGNYKMGWFISRCSSHLKSICERKQASLQ